MADPVPPTGAPPPPTGSVPPEAPTRCRRAARLLVVADRRVLLFRSGNDRHPAAVSWITPGGGLEAGEDSRAGAVRELWEETGLVVGADELVGPVHTEVVEYPTLTGMCRQSQEYFLVRTTLFAVDRAGHTEGERDWLGEARWWSEEELRTATEPVYPPVLADLVADLSSDFGGKDR